MERRDFLGRMGRPGMLAIAIGAVLLVPLGLGPSPAWTASPDSLVHLRLLDRLDRPRDGYCVDIPGTPRNMRIDIPLFAHNCKPTLTSDSAVSFTSVGLIRFPAVDRCLTVAGVNSAALPGAAILLRPCDESRPFFETAGLQRFTHRDDGRLVLVGSELCLSVGTRSAATYSQSDRWRTLFVDDCASTAPARSRWEFALPRR